MEADKIIQHSAYAMAADFVASLPRIAVAFCLLGLTWAIVIFANRALRNLLRRTRMRRALVDLVVEIADVGIWVVMAFVAASVAFPSVTPANILTGLGLGSVAIGFAFRDVFENFLAGILILYREPFRLGDCIECAKVEGFVEEITARDVHLRQTDGQRVVMPNAMLLKNPVWVRTDRAVRRTTILCGIALDEDVAATREVIRGAVEGLGSVSREQEVQIFAQSFGESSVAFEVTWWTGSRPVDVRRSRDEVIAAVKRALDEAGIKIAIPRRALAFVTPGVDASAEERSTVRAGNVARPRGP